jgi:dTDP-4-amino-4,6-dideoxygalactose transaminase
MGRPELGSPSSRRMTDSNTAPPEEGVGEALEELPFNRPYTTGAEFDYIREAIDQSHLSGNGPFARRCTELIERVTGCERALLTHSGTGALEMAVILAEVERGHEVIMPSFAFPSIATAVALRGAVPVFVDIRADTLNLDEALVEDAITAKTRAIVPIHYAGVAAEMDTLREIAERNDLLIIEDAAQGFLSTYHGRPLGNLGHLGAVSFHETKNVMCGEGGALLVNRPELVERAEIVQEKGTNRSKFFRGQIDKYTWVDLGSSYVVSDISAAFLWAQLERCREITKSRFSVWNAYYSAFEALEADGRLRRPVVPNHSRHNAHMYYVLLDGSVDRQRFIDGLAASGVRAVFHYVPLHSSPAGRRFGRTHGTLEVTDTTSERLVRLPLWMGMTTADAHRVARVTARVLVQI